MIKFIALVGRKPDWTRDSWVAHYRDRHGPLVAATADFVKDSIGYRQNEIVAAFPAHAGQDYDGLTELWFENAAAMERAFAAPDYLRDVRPDEMHFANPAAVLTVIGKPERLLATNELKSPCWHLMVLRGPIEHRSRSKALPENVCDATRMIISEAQDSAAQPYTAVEEFWFENQRDARDFETVRGPGDLVLLTHARKVYGRCQDGPA